MLPETTPQIEMFDKFNFLAHVDTTATVAEKRAAIMEYERQLLEMPQIKLEAKHYIAGGMYARELFMPKGSTVTGKIHLKEHLCHVSFGVVTVVEDTQSYLVVGPCTFVGKPGSKRVLLMHEDTLWTAFHTTDKLTVEECEATLATNDYNLLVEKL